VEEHHNNSAAPAAKAGNEDTNNLLAAARLSEARALGREVPQTYFPRHKYVITICNCCIFNAAIRVNISAIITGGTILYRIKRKNVSAVKLLPSPPFGRRHGT
jgi:hypothetical protein